MNVDNTIKEQRNMEQLRCKLCKSKRELTEQEIATAAQIIKERNLKPDALRDVWNLYDGETCPQGGYHKYEWNGEFFQKMIDDSTKIRDNETQIVRNNNENIELENKIKELQEKIEKNKETNAQLEKENIETTLKIKEISGREHKEWL